MSARRGDRIAGVGRSPWRHVRRVVVLLVASAASVAVPSPSVFGTAPLAAQSRIVTTVDTTRATVGDRVTLGVTVEHPPGTQLVWPDSLDLSPFEVLEIRPEPTSERDGVARSSARVVLTAFELGRLEIPSFEVAVVGPGGEREVLTTDRFALELESVGADESGDIRDIRGPLSIPLGLWRILFWTLLPLLAVALLYTVARRLRMKEEPTRHPALAPPERPAHDVALERLAALASSELLARGQVKEYHVEVSDILREYVERRFRVDALEMTTAEVIAGLRVRGVGEDFVEGLRAFLDQCDLVKFAKVRPSPDASRQVLELGRRLVLQSAPPASDSPAGEGTGPLAEARGEPVGSGRAPEGGA